MPGSNPVSYDKSGVHPEDAAHVSGEQGVLTLAVRTDTRASLAGTTGDRAPEQLTANGDVRVRDDDLNAQLAAVKSTDGDAQVAILYAHHEIHEGESFNASHANADLDTTDDDLLIEVGANAAHMTWLVAASAGCNLYLFENPTFTTGAAITAVNRNRKGTPDSPTLVVTHTPVDPGGAVDGTQLYVENFGVSGTPSKRASGAARGVSEWILKASTKYLFRVTSLQADTAININLDWYEE